MSGATQSVLYLSYTLLGNWGQEKWRNLSRVTALECRSLSLGLLRACPISMMSSTSQGLLLWLNQTSLVCDYDGSHLVGWLLCAKHSPWRHAEVTIFSSWTKFSGLQALPLLQRSLYPKNKPSFIQDSCLTHTYLVSKCDTSQHCQSIYIVFPSSSS